MDSDLSLDSEASSADSDTVVDLNESQGLPSGWELRYDPVLSEYYYINDKDSILQFDSPLEVVKRNETY
ncbi:hypothetical protein FOA43_001603 [Brettanomyces nanus]|uniref:WW domain-containing protein n=1 Tax=Eeniella nana TaxID=13502 RepID=A0A875RZX5_EENNA|nr:uncharacterized protein FOA43_001603 [Brettanomyces nanus]QPG74278.1 hypothetical protein FOA43_001603 [Brettanomyces nanus]